LVILAVLLLAYIAIQTSFVQNWLADVVTGKLSKALGTEIRVQKISFSIFNRLNMEGTLIRDRQKDTLLYAGQLKVRITDWFFLKDKIELKYAGLEDAVIKLNRKDSVWNYGFIADYFASTDTVKKEKKPVDFNLKKIDFKNLRFIKNDLWAGERMTLQVSSFLLDADTIDLKKNSFAINSIDLVKPFFGIQSLDHPLRPDSLRRKHSSVDTGMYFNPSDISVKVAEIKIKDGHLFIDSDEDKPVSHFDGAHIQLSKLEGSLKNIRFVKDTIRAQVNISAKDRCGFVLKKLKTDFRFTPQIMELADLDLQTNKSRLTNYYAMKYKDFNKDFGDYINKVVMNARFSNAKVSSDDIAYFAPELRTWKRLAALNGNFTGTVADFSISNLSAKIGATTHVTGSLSMKGLPYINTTRINFEKGTVQTNYFDLGTFIPALKDISSPNIAALGNIIYRGNFKGTVRNFVTAGSFSTQLGGVTTNISLELPRKKEPVYTGGIETTRFNLGKFLNDSLIGLVDFKGKIAGSSFNIDSIKTTIQGTALSLEYNQYTYSNIITLGTFQKKYFTGELKIDDPNLDFTSNVEIDLTQPLPRFNILGDLLHANLRELHLLNNPPVKLTGLLDVNFTGTNIDNFLGSAKFLNASIESNDNKLSFDSLVLSSSYQDSVKYLHLASNDFSANIEGKFNIKDLPNSFQSFLNHYYPAYIRQPAYIPRNQDFVFKVNTGNIEPYLRIFDAKLSGYNDAGISGSIDTRKNRLSLVANVPVGSYNKFYFTGLDIEGEGTMDTLSLKGNISSIQLSDSLRFPNTHFDIVSNQDHSEVTIKTSADNTLNDANLHADVYTMSDGARIQFRPSSFVLNEKKWNIEKSGELVLRSNLIQAKNVKFVQGFQEIAVETVPPADGSKNNNLAVRFKDVVLGDLSSVFFKNPRLEGVTNGTVALNDLSGQFHAAADLKVDQFRLNEDSIGAVTLTANYDSKTGDLPFSIQSPNEGYHFSASGDYNLKDTTGNSFTTDLSLSQSKIDILHMFLGDIFSEMSGQATGNLKISGNMKAPDLLGKISLRNAGMKVNYSQVYYTIDSADIRFENDGIDFGTIRIKDRYKNTGIVRGKLKEKGFKNLVFDFDLSTDKLLLLDTKATDNQQFYGNAIGSAKLSLKGPETAAQMYIEAVSNDSSHIYIPNSVSKETGAADFIVFKQYGTEMAKENNNSNFNLTVNLNLTATNQVNIDVILDELTGDVIKAVGNGRLLIKAGTTEPLSIRGQYNIDHGSYVFNFQGFIRKPFELLPDVGNYIKWDGDPFKADIHIDAQYTAERVSLSDLNLDISSAVKAYRGDVYVIAQLRNKLNKPAITFKLDFPQGSIIKSDNEFAQYLARLEKDQDQILNQVAYLILFNSFSPPNNSTGNNTGVNAYSISSIGVNTLSQMLTRGVNRVFSNLLHKITGDNSLRFDIGTSVYSSSSILNSNNGVDVGTSSGKLDRTRVDLKFGYALANDKIIVSVGSDIDFNLGAASSSGNTQWLPNVDIQFVLSPDKKLRLIIFNKASLDYNAGNLGKRYRQGVSISYRKDFDSFFGKKEPELEVKSPADSTAVRKNN
jgi:hypothetical protein